MVLAKHLLQRVVPPPAAPRIYLEPQEAAGAKARNAYQLHAIEIPVLRVLGFSCMAAFVGVHNLFISHTFSWATFLPLLVLFSSYLALSWIVLLRCYGKVRRVDVSLVFLLCDTGLILYSIYATGGDQSVLFFLLMARTADQANTTFARTLFFAHLSTLSYVLLLLYLAYIEQRGIAWPAAWAKVFFLYATTLYLSLTARTAEGLRTRLTVAVRLARTLLAQRQQAEHALRTARDELEQRVAERTTALAQANTELRDHIAARQQMEAEVLRARNLASIGVLAGGIAHDFNNLLTGILGNISLARRLAGMEMPVVARLTAAEQACQRATVLTQQLLTFATGGAPVRRTVALAELLPAAVAFALQGANVRSDLQIAAALWPVEADPGQLQQAIHNVVLNAAQAMPAGGTVDVRAENAQLRAHQRLSLPEGRYVHLTVQDYGEGIPPHELPHIFEPYFTTKPGGHGLGLATAYSIVTKHDGAITVDSAVGVGTTVSIYLPASAYPVPPVLESPALPRSGRILVMDDEVMIQELLREILTSLGYAVECVGDGTAAVAAYQQAQAAGQAFAAVILDLTIPGQMGGVETLVRLQALDPQVCAIVSSGYAQDPVLAHFAQYGFRAVIAKPYTVEGLHAVLQRVLGGQEPDC